VRLAVLNGSPRGPGSNTDALLEAFLGGLHENSRHTHELFHLVAHAQRPRAVQAFADADAALLAFPLYVDSMPAPVAEFVELLRPLCGRPSNPRLLFLVQSGFPEACHSRPVERWAEKLSRRLGSPYVGTIVKGGVEGIRSQPGWMTKPMLDAMRALGRRFGDTGELDGAALTRLAKPERLGLWGRFLFRSFASKLAHAFWNWQLKKNGALAERDARPYAPSQPAA